MSKKKRLTNTSIFTHLQATSTVRLYEGKKGKGEHLS